MDFRTEHNTLDTSKRKRELRAELEKAMLEYKGKITVLPNNIGMPVTLKTQKSVSELRSELADRLSSMEGTHKNIASMLGISGSLFERMLRRDLRVRVSQVKIALNKVRNYERV